LIIVNIQLANEYIEQMQLMLKDYYDRPDLELVNYDGQDLSLARNDARETFFVVASLANQPKLTVRMGLNEPSLQVWNSSVKQYLSGWEEIYKVSLSPKIITIDFPRLLCAVIYRENYCSPDGSLVNSTKFQYGWTVYAP
jgi:hypothetical protein